MGLCFQSLNSRAADKTGNAQKKFEELCLEAGGVMHKIGSQAKCRLMIVQQYQYQADFVASISEEIESGKTWGFLTLASMGLDQFDAFLTQFDISRLTVPDKGLAEFLLKNRGAASRYENLEMIEVGLPFKKYPVFEEFSADWIIAAPTLFSFHTEAGKQQFLRNVLKLLSQIHKNDLVVYKSHNGNKKDYFTPRLYVAFVSFISWLPNAEKLLEWLMPRLTPMMKPHASKILTGLLFKRLMRRVKPMNELTSLADMSLEAFLPGVCKGVIGGESNTIWGTLFFGLPYYNCVSPDERRQGSSELINKKSDALLDLNLRYFGVPYCDGRLEVKEIKKLSTAQQHHDLLGCIQRCLIECKSLERSSLQAGYR